MEKVCIHAYIYICIDISSWCILPRLKVEHIITHLDRYGVDCKKKQWENQMSRHQVKRRQDILHVSQVFCWAPPLISPSNHPMQKVEIQWIQISQKKWHSMVFGVQLFPCWSKTRIDWMFLNIHNSLVECRLHHPWCCEPFALNVVVQIRCLDHQVLPEGPPGPWFCPSSAGHDADPCPVRMGFEMEDPGNWIDHCTSKIVRALIFFFWKVCFLIGCGLSNLDVRSGCCWRFGISWTEGN